MSTPTLQQSPLQQYTRILGVGAYRPDVVVTNDDICQWIESSDEWIRQRTGIVTRVRARPEVSVLDMAEAAARQALENAGLEGSQLDAVIVATVSHPHATPSLAARLTDMLGATPAPAFDISAACAGYCYGVAQADALVRSGMARHVLVIGAEKLSDYIDNHERTISFLLGDGAGAVVVGPSDAPGIGPSVWGSDGSKADTIAMTRSQLDLRDIALGLRDEDITPALWPTLRQDGPSVFRWAVWSMAKIAAQALEAAGITVDQLAAFLPHQANMRIIDEMAKQLQMPEHVVIARDIADTGNTSAASIPLAMQRLLHEHPDLSGKLALQIGFGAGLVYGAQVVVLP